MYTLSTPDPALQPYIEYYWHVLGGPDRPFDLSVDVFVDLRADLIFNFGVPYHRTVHGADRMEIHASNLDAQRLRPIRVEQRGAVVVTGVRFRTGGLMPFVARPVSEWNDQVVPLAAAFGEEIMMLEEALRAAGEQIAVQAAAMDAFFLERCALTESMTLTLALKTAIETHDGRLRIDELCALGNASQRQVDRLFRKHIGVGPKTFSRVTRFQRGLHWLRTDAGVTLGTVAARTGYSDHSHFVREFKRFAGVAPSHKLGYFPADAPTDFSPNLVRFVQDAGGT